MKDISLFCGISSLGMPFSKENKQHIGYYDIILYKLRIEGYNVSGFNMSKLNKKHTWDMESKEMKFFNLDNLPQNQNDPDLIEIYRKVLKR